MASRPYYAYPCLLEDVIYNGSELWVANYSVNQNSAGQWIFREGHGQIGVEMIFYNENMKPAAVLCFGREYFRLGREVELDRGWVPRSPYECKLDLL